MTRCNPAAVAQSNEGGVSQTGGEEQYSSGKGNAVIGGDLKDYRSNEAAAQNKVLSLSLRRLCGVHSATPCQHNSYRMWCDLCKVRRCFVKPAGALGETSRPPTQSTALMGNHPVVHVTGVQRS